MAAHQCIDADGEHGPHDLGRERAADTHGMAQDQVALQFLGQARLRLRHRAGKLVAQAMRAQQLVGIAAETGGDAIDRFAAAHLCGEEIGRVPDLAELRRVERHRRATRHRQQAGTGQRLAVQKDGLAHERLLRGFDGVGGDPKAGSAHRRRLLQLHP